MIYFYFKSASFNVENEDIIRRHISLFKKDKFFSRKSPNPDNLFKYNH